MKSRYFAKAVLFLLALVPATAAFAQRPTTPQEGGLPPDERGRPRVGVGTLRVKVRNATGSPLETQALVRVQQRVGTIFLTDTTKEMSTAEFKGLPAGDYIVEVVASGFLTATEEASLHGANDVAYVFILLRPDGGPAAPGPASGTILTPKANKEVQAAIQALESNNLAVAEKHLQRAEKMAPGHPEVQYLIGLLLVRKNDMAGARQRFEKAISLYPQHAAALGALGRLFLREGDLTAAAGAFERALVADARSQENHTALAAVLFEQKSLEKARYHAEQALDIAAGKLPETRLLLSQILIAQGDHMKAAEVLQQFLVDYPHHQDAATARRLQAALISSPASAAPRAPAQPAARPASEGASPQSSVRVTQAGARLLSLPSLSAELAPGAIAPAALRWAPENIDETPPAIFRDVPCSQEDVIKRAGQRVSDLITNLGNINAAERISHIAVDAHGRPGRTDAAAFEYMFSYRQPRPGVLWVEEVRDGSQGSPMVGGVGTSGFAAMALVFHPYYSGDFEMTCEGQGSWKGEPVWYVRFQQRADKIPRMRSYSGAGGSAGLRFKGRAWIAANSYQIVRIETDVISPPKELRFESEHMVIEYAPVEFKERKLAFWLPMSADIYAHVGGKRWHRSHSLSEFVHFAVDTKQKIASPNVPNEPAKPPQK